MTMTYFEEGNETEVPEDGEVAEVAELIRQYGADLREDIHVVLGEDAEFDVRIEVEEYLDEAEELEEEPEEEDGFTSLLALIGLGRDAIADIQSEIADPYADDVYRFAQSEPKSHRRDLLEEAISLIDGDRNADYGDPIQDFRRTGNYWSGHLAGVLERKARDAGVEVPADVMQLVETIVDPHDVAIMMDQLKTSRLAWSPHKRDNWTDKAGYTGCGYDCVVRENDV